MNKLLIPAGRGSALGRPCLLTHESARPPPPKAQPWNWRACLGAGLASPSPLPSPGRGPVYLLAGSHIMSENVASAGTKDPPRGVPVLQREWERTYLMPD